MKKALIIDLNSLLYKSFYKLMNMSNSKGFPTGALFGFINSFLSAIKRFEPNFIVACLDSSRSSLKRREILESYKENRDTAPEPLALQIKKAKELLKVLGASILFKEGYEADDMIASAVEYFSSKGVESIIVTSDKDLMQLVPQAIIYNHSKDLIIDTSEKVEELIGVAPDKIVDLFAFMGDASDGIPGVKGVGPKTAVNLIKKFGSVDDVLASIDELPTKLKEKIEENEELLKKSRELAKLSLTSIDNIKEYKGFTNNLKDILEELEFRSVLKKLNLEREEESVSFNEVDKIVLTKDSFVYFEDGKFAIYDNSVIISDNIDFNNVKVDVFNAKNLFKDLDFNLGLDIMIGYHLLNPSERTTPEKMIRRTFNIEAKDIATKATYLNKLCSSIKEDLKKNNLEKVYESIEKPLITILADMEKKGVEVDVNYLEEHKKELEEKITKLSDNIKKLADEDFNIASPKQLSFILFEKLQLPIVKKTKTGYSTDSEVLEQLSSFEIVKSIIEFRKLTKLYTTYVLPLIKSGPRVHTTYHQDGTATGRLSSSNPNLQNIPSRGEEGLKVRRAFTSSKGKLLVLDYSQIELRILASLSEDKALMEAYNNDLDLHTQTAKKIFGENITKYDREKAKIVNFSLIYGKSSFGLAKELNISLKESAEYIDKYFKEYPKVKEFIDSSIALAQKQEYVETMFGRKRFLQDINSKNRILRNASERMVANTIIQGTQAEIIKKAMIDIYEFIKDKNIDMIMQVHDELVFEIDENSLMYREQIEKIMENACKLKVPLKVNSYVVNSWDECK